MLRYGALVDYISRSVAFRTTPWSPLVANFVSVYGIIPSLLLYKGVFESNRYFLALFLTQIGQKRGKYVGYFRVICN
jgi:hypothetical protein